MGLSVLRINYLTASALVIDESDDQRKKVVDALEWKGFDPKYVFYIGLIVSGTGHVFFALQEDVWLGFIARCFHEIGDGAMIFSIFYGIARIFNIERIGGNASFVTLVQILGVSISSFIFGPLGHAYGYYLPLFITGITTICSFILLFYWDRKKLQKA